MKKILHLTDDLNVGGLERTVQSIVLGLDKKKFSQKVCCLKGKGIVAEVLERQGVEVKLLGIYGALRPAGLIRLRKYLKKESPDILHCHGHYVTVWGIIASLFLPGIKKIVHAQNLYYDLTIRAKIKERVLSVFADKYIAVSEAVRECLTGHIGVSKRKIVVIYNSGGLNAPGRLKAAQLKRKYGIRRGDFVAGTVARLVEIKGIRYVLEALKSLRAEARVKYIIAGRGPEEKKLKGLVTRFGLKDSVVFAGESGNVSEILSMLDVFVLPSTLKEGMPLVLAEALSAGLPAVTTDIGGNTEAVINGENGIVVPIKDSGAIASALRVLYGNSALRKHMGSKSLKIYKKYFRKETALSRIKAVYESVL